MSDEVFIDLRSDLLSPIGTASRRAIYDVCDGHAVFGLREDRYQKRLEEEAAELLGKEDALFFPACGMANLVASMLVQSRGSTALVAQDCHVLTSEAAGISAIAGLMPMVLPGPFPAVSALEAALMAGDDLRPGPALLWLENTHNRAGGAVMAADHSDMLCAVARSAGLRSHLDGSRILNAAVALNVAPSMLTAGFDTVSMSLNKGIGAPVGAILAGDTASISAAVRLRQMLGGGIRPSSLVCAPALAALRDWQEISLDHANARMMWQEISDVLADGGAGFGCEKPQTNILLLSIGAQTGWTAAALCAALAAKGVHSLVFGGAKLRFVLHRGITASAAQAAARVIAQTITSPRN